MVDDRASLFVDDPWQNCSPGIDLRREAKPRTIEVERIAVEPADPYQLELENVGDAIRGEAPLLLGRDDALGQARVIEALHESATSGTPVDLEPVLIPANDRSTS
jgi:predicted dehydrogenase